LVIHLIPLETFIIPIGSFILLGLIFGLFFSIGDRTKYRDATALYPVDSEEFLQAIGHLTNSPILPGQDIKILNNGDEFFPALIKAINSASKSVSFSVYIWESGKVSDMVFEALIKKAREGVFVKVLVDGFGGFFVPTDKIQELKDAGGLVVIFRATSFGKLMRFHRRNHSRTIVIDGQVAFTGGMAMADHWLGSASNPKEWRDMMFELRGEMSQSLQAVFARLWAGTRGEILAGSAFYPVLPPNAYKTSSRFVSIASSPSPDMQPLPKFFWFSMASARRNIYITSSYVIPEEHIRKILMDRAKAGLDVRLMVPDSHTDAKPIRLASHFYFEDFLKAGIKIYEYTPTMIHSKVITIDGYWSIVGSANMDVRSLELNEENVMGIADSKFAKDLEKVFMEDLKKTKQLNLNDWKKRSLWKRLGEVIFVFFQKQY